MRLPSISTNVQRAGTSRFALAAIHHVASTKKRSTTTASTTTPPSSHHRIDIDIFHPQQTEADYPPQMSLQGAAVA